MNEGLCSSERSDVRPGGGRGGGQAAGALLLHLKSERGKCNQESHPKEAMGGRLGVGFPAPKGASHDGAWGVSQGCHPPEQNPRGPARDQGATAV